MNMERNQVFAIHGSLKKQISINRLEGDITPILSKTDINFLQQELSAYEAEHGVIVLEDGNAPTASGCSGDCYGTCKGTVSCICGGSCSGTCVGSTK
jgi:modification target Cys-rich repeat protein